MENTFEQKTAQERQAPDGAFTQKIGKTTFTFNLFFSPVSQDKIEDKIKNLLTREVMSGKVFT